MYYSPASGGGVIHYRVIFLNRLLFRLTFIHLSFTIQLTHVKTYVNIVDRTLEQGLVKTKSMKGVKL